VRAMKLKSMISWALIFSVMLLVLHPLSEAIDIKAAMLQRVKAATQAAMLPTPKDDATAIADTANTATLTSDDYANPDFSDQSFEYNDVNGKESITHYFKFGDKDQSIVYNKEGNIPDQTLSDKYKELGLNSKYSGDTIKFFLADKSIRFSDSTTQLIAIKNPAGSYTVIGLYTNRPTQENSGNLIRLRTISCLEGNQTTDGTTISFVLSGRAVPLVNIGDTQGAERCLYDPIASQDSSIPGGTMITNKNYITYVKELNSILLDNPVETESGTTKIAPSADIIKGCAADNLSKPINESHPEYYSSYVDTLVELINDDVPKRDNMKEFLNSNNIRLSDAEDIDLYKAFYSGGTETSDHAGAYMNKSYQAQFVDLANRIQMDRSFTEIDKNEVWFETLAKKSKALSGLFVLIGIGAGVKFGPRLAGALGKKLLSLWPTRAAAAADSPAEAAAVQRLIQAIMGPGTELVGGEASGGIIASLGGVAAVIATLAVVILGIIAAISIIKAYEQLKDQDTLNLAHDGLKLLYAIEYMNMNVINQKCTGEWDKYQYQQKIYNNLTKLGSSTLTDIQQSLADAADNMFPSSSECRGMKIDFIGITVGNRDGLAPFAWALCNITKLLYDIAINIEAFGYCLMSKSIGANNVCPGTCVFGETSTSACSTDKSSTTTDETPSADASASPTSDSAATPAGDDTTSTANPTDTSGTTPNNASDATTGE
jgi:hypothetical protein